MAHEELIGEIQQVRFSPVRGRQGYDMGEVDAFLDRLVEAVRQDAPVDRWVADARFTPTRLREGYEMGEVDAFLDRVVVASTSAPEPGTAVPPSAPGAPLPLAPAIPNVVQEQRGIVSRLLGRRRR